MPIRSFYCRLIGFAFALVLTWLAAPAQARAQNTTVLNTLDKHPGVVLSPDALGASFTGPGVQAVRSDIALAPGGGFKYFEARRVVGTGDFGVGVATAAVGLDAAPGDTNQGLSVNTIAGIYTGGAFVGGFPVAANSTYGIAVDYRGDHPTVHVVARTQGGGPAVVVATRTLAAVSVPLHIVLFGQPVGAGVQIELNPGNDLSSEPFELDAGAALGAAVWLADAGLVLGWNAPPTLVLAGGDRVGVVGAQLALFASAANFDGADLGGAIQWSVDPGGVQGAGPAFVFTPLVLGPHTISARVVGTNGQLVSAELAVHSISSAAIDSDDDGLDFAAEVAAGTDALRRDTDGDGVRDGEEVLVYGTQPLVADTDGDGMPDGFEVRFGFDPTTLDAAIDGDGDGVSNGGEWAAGTDPSDPAEYPGSGAVPISAIDRHPSTVLSANGTAVAYTEAGPRGARSDIAALPGTGWHYAECERLVPFGDFGFGLATASESLVVAGGESNASFSVRADGSVRFGGVTVAQFADPAIVRWYGVALDTDSVPPIAHVLVGGDTGAPAILGPFALAGSAEPLHLHVWGDAAGLGPIQQINGDGGPQGKGFRFPAAYHLHLSGVLAAEFLGSGFGPSHAYAGVPELEQVGTVRLVKDAITNAGAVLAVDGLAASYTANQKSALRANQPMVGEFRYFETRRHVAPINIGQGVINPFAAIDPYCCVTSELTGAPPSMSVNSLTGVWRNLVFQTNYDTSNDHYGFAVDYRGARPTVHVIVGDTLAASLTLTDFIAPAVPMLYGDPAGPVQTNSINFGARPFRYDPAAVLSTAGVDASGLVLGWGAANTKGLGQNLPSSVVIAGTNAPIFIGDTLSTTATAIDVNGADISTFIRWSDNRGGPIQYGALYQFTPSEFGVRTLTAQSTDSLGVVRTTSVTVEVLDLDSDNDGLTDTLEGILGTNPFAADTDADGMPDGWEVANGLDPLFDDAAGDPDLDSAANLVEFLAGTDPQSDQSYPGAPFATFLSPLDKHPDVVLSPDGLGTAHTGFLNTGVRSDRALAPGEGFRYFEGRRLAAPGDFGVGISTAVAPLLGNPGETSQGLAINTLGFLWHNGGFAGGIGGGTQDTYGIAVDYRGSYPIVYVVTSNTVGGPGALVQGIGLMSITDPVHIHVFGFGQIPGEQARIQPGNGLGGGFVFNAKAILMDAGVPGAAQIQMGWNPTVAAPKVTIGTPSANLDFGTSLVVSATAQGSLGLDLTASIQWLDETTGATGSGGSFLFLADPAGPHVVRAAVVEQGGAIAFAKLTLNVVAPDADGDGIPDHLDGCPLDPLKGEPLICGCGVPETDSDGDGVPDCVDGCPQDPKKSAPGLCGCGIADLDSDGDGVLDCLDGCPFDPTKLAPGDCGCGTTDVDSDGDGVPDCFDACPLDPTKVAPGLCGCGVAETDTDGDGVPDCFDGCPLDPAKVVPGACGCGVLDLDSDGDGVPDCFDSCPLDPLKIDAGLCGCGLPEGCSLLNASPSSIPIATGGEQVLDLVAGAAHAGRLYFVLGSATGTVPGLPVDGLSLPLNFDVYFSLTLSLPNSSLFVATLGFLDGEGRAQARIHMPPSLPIAAVALHLDHAYLVLDPIAEQVVLTSNAVGLDLVP